MGLFIILTLLMLLIIIDLALSRKDEDETSRDSSQSDLSDLGLPRSWDEHYDRHRPWLRLKARGAVEPVASKPGRRQGPHTLDDHDSPR